MAKTKKAVDNIDELSHEDAIAAVKTLTEELAAEKEAHTSTKETTDQIISELTEENKTLSAKLGSVKVKGDNGNVTIDGKVYPIMLAKFQVAKGDLKGIYSAKDLQENAALAKYVLGIGSAVLGAAIK